MLSRMWAILSTQERSQAIVLLLAIFIGMLLEVLSIGLILPLFSVILDPEFTNSIQRYLSERFDLLTVENEIVILSIVVGFLAVYIFKTLALVLILKKRVMFVYTLQANLSQRLFARYLMRDYSFHTQRNSSELIRNTITEITLLVQNGVLQLIIVIAEVAVLAGVICFLLYINPMITMIAVVIVAGVQGTFYFLFKSRIFSWGKQRQFHEGLRIKHVQQGFGGIKDIKLLGREAEFISKFRYHTERAVEAGRLSNLITQYPRLILELVSVFILSLCMFVIVFQGLKVDEILPVLAVFAAAGLRLIPSANRIVNALQVAKYISPIVYTIHSEFTNSWQFERVHIPTKLPLTFQRNIVLSNVSFSYPGSEEYFLHNINLMIEHGDSVGFIGSSGAGKSTIIDLILGLLSVGGGSVCVDGTNIEENLKEWQSLIGYVPQTVYLSDESIRANVAYGVNEENIDDIAVIAAVESAQLAEFIGSLPQGIETPVGERGVRMSGGQLQRLGIARALYHNPDILVLDEATSALDSETEASVMDSVRSLKGQKTVIIVAHRFSTVRHCNMIYELQGGRIVNQGPPNLVLPKDI
jgi:ATP-binding cassette, subfamily B, bacterial PglK